MIIPYETRVVVEFYVEEMWNSGVDGIKVCIDKSGVYVSTYRGNFGHNQNFSNIEHLNIHGDDLKRFAKFLAEKTMREFKRFEEGA